MLQKNDLADIIAIEIFIMARRGWRWILIGCCLGLFGACLFIFVTPVQYQAIVIIRPATVGLFDSDSSMDVEPGQAILHRLKSPSFYSDKLFGICGGFSSEEIAKQVRVNIVKDTSLIRVQYSAHSAVESLRCTRAIFDRLAEQQNLSSEPLIKNLKDHILLVQNELAEARQFQAKLHEKILACDSRECTIRLSKLSKNKEINNLNIRLLKLNTRLTKPITQPSLIVEPIYSSGSPVFPRKNITILLGALGGGLWGWIFFMFRIFLLRINSKNQY